MINYSMHYSQTTGAPVGPTLLFWSPGIADYRSLRGARIDSGLSFYRQQLVAAGTGQQVQPAGL